MRMLERLDLDNGEWTYRCNGCGMHYDPESFDRNQEENRGCCNLNCRFHKN